MKILLAIVHFWDPEGSGRHQSLRPHPGPRVGALQQQILALRRLANQQYELHVSGQGIFRSNHSYRNQIDLHLITDGEHTVLEHLEPDFRACITEVVTQPESGMMLPFEAHRHLGEVLRQDQDPGYDLYGYLEDDLIIHDPQFFQKIHWFQDLMGTTDLLLPQRVEYLSRPHLVDHLFIDGPMAESDQVGLNLEHGQPVVLKAPGGDVLLEAPKNPHAGCFFLSAEQLRHWMDQPHWLDRDCGFVSPLESAATLGLMKTFRLYKPAFSNASWLELQHWGNSFHKLMRVPEAPVG